MGPRLVRHLATYLSTLESGDPRLTDWQWWIVPHINPDGELRNATWADEDAIAYELGPYLKGSVRELPGDDIEFGFPRDHADAGARPENRAVFDWWRTFERPLDLHVSLHGTGFGAGPWFLIDEAWQNRCAELKSRCLQRVSELGYLPHDVERNGEKGFKRLERGFCTRPDSRSMREYFQRLGDPGRQRSSGRARWRRLGPSAATH